MGRFLVVSIGLLVISITSTKAQILINEIQSSNYSTIKDDFNEFPDWIELFNSGDVSVNLAGWTLSDDLNDSSKWTFPDITLAPQSYMLIYASGRDILQQPTFWNSIIDEGDTFRYIVPTDTVSANWMAKDYSDMNWALGESGFGYSDNDDITVLPQPLISVYLRKAFSVSNISEVNELILNVDYDDAFVAYINGVEVARANIGAAGSNVTYNQLAEGNHEALIYQGGQPEMFDISNHINLLNSGDNLFTMEVHNVSAGSSDFTAIPILTVGSSSASDEQKPSKYFPFGSKGLHTNFKLKSNGESLMLYNENKILIDSFSSVAIGPNLSFGRLANSPQTLEFFMIPTPGKKNPDKGYDKLTTDRIEYSKAGGFYTGNISVNLSASAEDTIYYTVDGSEPTNESLLYSDDIIINKNTVVRARIIKNGFLPSPIYSQTYINSRKSDLPVVSISTNPENLWDYYTGMYEMGPGAEPDNPHFGANFWMDWEYPFQFEMFDKSGKQVLSQVVGAKIFGAWSRATAQKSFALLARKSYGESYYNYPIFNEKPLEYYRSLVIRNAGNDWSSAMMRDGLITGITSHLGLDYQGFQPVSTYLNGEYWGMYNIREKINEHFLALNHNLNPDDIIILEADGNVVIGDNADYIQLTNYLNSNVSLGTSEKYKYVSDKVDIDNFIKYQLVQIYIHNDDWPGNNIKYWKTIHPGSKWRYILYDTDFGFGIYNESSYTNNTLEYALEPDGPGWPNPPWSTLMFRRLITNESFRHNFINQLADNINTTFLPSNIIRYTDSLKSVVNSEMPYHLNRWGRSYDDWSWQVERIKNWGQYRPSYMRNHIRSYFNLPNQHLVTLNVSDESHGHIRLNSLNLSDFPFSGIYFQEVPIDVEAVPAPGYKFVSWEGDVTHDQRTFSFDLTAQAAFKAIFEKVTEEKANLVINEINYNSPVGSDAGDWVEIYNNSTSTFDIQNYQFAELSTDSVFYMPNPTIIEPGGYLVISKNLDKFKAVYPDIQNVTGEINFGLSSSGDEIRLYNYDGAIIDAVDYLPYSPWPVEANGTGATLELIHPNLDNGQAENWVAIKNGGTPGAKNSNYSNIQVPGISSESIADISAFPNSFSDYTTVKLNLSLSQKVRLEVVDINGRIIEVLSDSYLPSGDHFFDWIPNGNTVGGIYIIRLLTNNNTYNAKVTFIQN